ncbi:MAG: CusA/CzcA family heavy metal efflux RND transporter, partial [Ignavibacteriota bacterium]
AVTIDDIATVGDAPAVRQGASTENGIGEVVAGLAMMLKGKNSREVSKAVAAKVEEIQKTLPKGIRIVPFYNRSELVTSTISTVIRNLAEGCILVIVIVLLLFMNLRAGFIVASVIPLAMLFAVTVMYSLGQSGNLMSLGAIDFGLIIDGSIIVVEACLATLVHRSEQLGRLLTREERDHTIITSSSKMLRPAQYGQFIILIVYLPIYTLQGIEGKMFRPMAWTVSFALIGALLLTLTYVPAMTALILRPGKKERLNPLISWAERIYLPLLDRVLKRPIFLLSGAIGSIVAAVIIFLNLGGEFIPKLDEGDIVLESRKLPSVSLTESIRISGELEKAIKQFPEVKHVITKLGRPDIANDPMSIEQGDVYINLEKDKSKWKTATTKAELIEKMTPVLAEIPGVAVSFSQPIEMRFNELISGIRSDVGIKIFGDDFDKLNTAGSAISRLMRSVKGAEDIQLVKIEGLPQIAINPNREQLKRYGISISTVNEAIEIALAGKSAGKYFEGVRSFDLVVRYGESARSSIEDIRALPISLPTYGFIRLDAVADIIINDVPPEIRHEQGQRLLIVAANVRGRDIAGFVTELKEKIDKELHIPDGYRIEFDGQFKNLERASARFQLVVPLALLLIFSLLYQTFKSVKNALLVYSGIPFSIIGGIAALAMTGLPFSMSVGVGFIALFGVAVLNGIVLVSAISESRKSLSLLESIRQACQTRLRPVLTTALVASLGFIPMAIATGPGAEVQKPLATVVIGGLITSTILTLLLLPALYKIFHRNEIRVE